MNVQEVKESTDMVVLEDRKGFDTWRGHEVKWETNAKEWEWERW